MADASNAYGQLWQQCRESTTVEELLRVLDQAEDLARTAELTIREVYDLKAEAFQSLRELTIDDPVTGQSLIVDCLLPLCSKQPPDAPSEVNRAISRCQETLAEWLDQYSQPERRAMRDVALDRLRTALLSGDPQGACRTIARIGFRRSDIVDALWRVATECTDEVGDIALSTLTSLGVADEEREKLLSVLHERATLRCTVPLVAALRTLADPTSIDVVVENWLKPSDVEVGRWLGHIALRLPIDVADAREHDAELQDHMWHLVSELCAQYPELYSSALHLGSDMAPRCDSEAVVPTLLRWLAKGDKEPERAAHHRYLACLRLEQCARPRQLRGWERVDEPMAVSLLSQDAMQDTQHKGYAPDLKMLHKEMAWKTLLSLGHADVLTWFEKSVAMETNSFLRQSIEDLLACFRMDPLPPTVVHWVTETYDMKLNQSSGEWAPRMAAIEMARSAASRQAFEALLNFGLTHDRKPLQRSVDALAEVAMLLANSGDTSITDSLMKVAVDGKEPHHRVAALGALNRMAAENLLSTGYAAQLEAMVFEEEREPFERSLIVSTLGHLEDISAPRVLDRLRTWARDRDDWLGGRSLEALARHGHLTHERDILAKRLGLEEAGEEWGWAPGRERLEWAPFIVSLLYLEWPAAFISAIASMLRTLDWAGAVQVMRVLSSTHGDNDRPSLPVELGRALLDRARERQTRTSAEMGVFPLLARLIPDAMARESWDDTWSDWLPDPRAALADALGEANYTRPEAQDKAASLLLSLTQDGQYAVRRAAYRGLARQSESSLLAACEAWSRAPSVELRRRGTEAWGWLVSVEDQADRPSHLYQRFSFDPERTVRDAVKRARGEARERRWTDECLSRVRGLESDDNELLLSVSRYGQALAQVGDDTSLKILRTDLETRRLPPNVRHWLRQIAKGIGDRWRKVTRKWPDPWLPWEGAIEECEGTLATLEGQSFKVHYSLWSQPPPTPSEKHSWGGAAWPVDLWDVGRTSEFCLRLADGRQGKAIIENTSGNMATFLGQGGYPEQASGDLSEDSPQPTT